MTGLRLPMAPMLAWRPTRLAGLDTHLLLSALALVSIGVVMIASASIGLSTKVGGTSFDALLRHVAYVLISATLAFAVIQVQAWQWYRYSGWLLAAALLLLVLVLMPGVEPVKGSRRWLGFGLLTLQVSEVAKLAVIVFIAAYLQRHQVRLRAHWSGCAGPLGVLAVVGLLLMLEPDYGATVVISATVLGILFLAGIRLWNFALLLAAGGSALAVLAIAEPYRWQRLTTFLDPWADRYKDGYQLVQSQIAFGRGEWFGVGLGNSVQKLSYLPEAHNDFILAIVAEELGLLGVVAVLGLFVVLVSRILFIARQAAARHYWFAAYAAFGIGILIAGQAIINVSVASGLAPTKGLTLPLVSYGGSSLVVCVTMVALVLRIGIDVAAMGEASERVKRERSGG